ncbi:TniQ family protein [Methylobacterium sp. JK268]
MPKEPPKPARDRRKRDEEFEPRALRVRFRPEPAYSLFGRLAARNGETSCRAFGAEVGLRYLGDVLAGRRIAAVENLAGLAGANVARYTAVRSGAGQVVLLNGETLLARSWAPKKQRYCPRCLEGDLRGTVENDGPRPFRPYRRTWWDVTHVDNCPIHCCKLLRACPVCAAPIDVDYASPWQCRCGGDLTKAVATPRSPCECSVDRYVVGRLGGCEPLPLPVLDRVTLEAAVWAAFYVGWIADHGRALDMRQADDATKAAARRRGLELLADWPLSFKALLDAMVEDVPSRDLQNLSPRTAYGALSMWLARSPEPSLEPLREIVRSHAETSRRSAPRGISFTEAANRLRVTRKTFLAIARQHGLVPTGTNLRSRIVLDDETVSKVRDLLTQPLGQRHAAKFLGISVPAFQRLVDAGVVAAHDPVVTSRRDKTYSPQELERLLGRLAGDAPERQGLEGDDAGLPAASFKGRVGLDRLLPAILDGRVRPKGRLPSAPGLQGIIVSVGDVVSLHGQPSDSMLLEEAAKRFGVNYWGFLGLVRSGLIPARKALGRTNKRWWVRKDDFDRFCDEYGTVRHLAERHDLSRVVTRAIIDKLGLKPASVPQGHFVEVYRFRDAEAALANSWEARDHRATRKRRPKRPFS